MVLFQHCVWWPCLTTKMATLLLNSYIFSMLNWYRNSIGSYLVIKSKWNIVEIISNVKIDICPKIWVTCRYAIIAFIWGEHRKLSTRGWLFSPRVLHQGKTISRELTTQCSPHMNIGNNCFTTCIPKLL